MSIGKRPSRIVMRNVSRVDGGAVPGERQDPGEVNSIAHRCCQGRELGSCVILQV
jgi:hypothetical protein